MIYVMPRMISLPLLLERFRSVEENDGGWDVRGQEMEELKGENVDIKLLEKGLHRFKSQAATARHELA